MKKFFSPIIIGLSPAFIILFVVLAIIFHANPQWDLQISELFYTTKSHFYMGGRWWAKAVYHGVHYATTAVIVVFALFIIVSIVRKKNEMWGIARKSVVYMLIVMILGPGLTVNTLLKDNVGRARPADVTQFGGDLLFTPPFEMSNQCEDNCSFVSGHSSFGFYWIVLAFLACTVAWKVRFTLLALLFGGGIGLVRIIQGRHFFSDVVFSFFFVYTVAAVVYWIMYIWPEKRKAVPR